MDWSGFDLTIIYMTLLNRESKINIIEKVNY